MPQTNLSSYSSDGISLSAKARGDPCANRRHGRALALPLALIVPIFCQTVGAEILAPAKLNFSVPRSSVATVRPSPDIKHSVLLQQPALPVLKPGETVRRQIEGGTNHSFTLSLDAGQYLAISIEQHGSILLATLSDPNGKSIIAMDYPAGGYGPIHLSHIALLSGKYQLEIRSVNTWAIEAPYDVTLTTLRTAEPADETVVKAQSLFAEGKKKYQDGQREPAIELYEQSLALWNALQDSHWRALTRFAMSGVYFNGSEKQQAQSKQYLEEALAILKNGMADNDWRLLASTLNDLGGLYGRRGEINKAEDLLNQSLRLYAANQDRRGQASALNSLAGLYLSRGDLSVAREMLEKALEFRRAENDKPGELNLLSNLAVLSDRLGEPDRAFSLLSEVLQRWREIPPKDLRPDNRDKIVLVLNNLAAASDKLGDWDRASSYYEAALKEFRPDDSKMAATLDNLGEHYASLSNPVKARQLYEEALQLLPASAKPNPDIKAGILVHLGQLSIAEGNFQAALNSFDEALALNPNQPRQVDVLTNRGAALVLKGEVANGLAAYDQAWSIQEKLKTEDRRAKALILQRRGEALALLDKPIDALGELTRALNLWKAVKNAPEEATTLLDMARLESKQGNLESALAHNQQAIGIIESLRSHTANRQLQTSYFAKHEDYYALDIELKMRLSEDNKLSDYVGQALESNEKARARVLIEALGDAGLRIDCKGPVDRTLAELVNERCSLQNKLTAKANARIQILSGPHSPQQIALLDHEIDEIVEKYEGIDSQIRSRKASFASVTKPTLLTWKQIQQQLDESTLLIEYSLGERHSYVWAVTPNSIDGFELTGRDEIEAAVRRLTAAMTTRNREVKSEDQPAGNARAKADADAAAAATDLSRMILSRLAPLLGQKRLVIVADGALQTIPFASLPVPTKSSSTLNGEAKTNASPANINSLNPPLLVDDHEIVTLPSASVLAMQRREFANRKTAPLAVAVLANPVFESSDQRVRSANRNSPQSAAGKKAKQTADGQPKGPPAGASELTRALENIGVDRLSWLPYSLEEAKAIMKVAPPGQSMQALDFQASRATAMSPELSRYRIVHFATHGIVDLEHPELSGMVLSRVDKKGNPQDGYLRLHDIYDLNLSAELVVLSACETGVGKQVKGEGLIALTRGFMYAGATSVVASLWKVDDASTAALMAQFYREMFINGRKPSAALREAQVYISKQRAWRSPYYWAGFVLQGEWR